MLRQAMIDELTFVDGCLGFAYPFEVVRGLALLGLYIDWLITVWSYTCKSRVFPCNNRLLLFMHESNYMDSIEHLYHATFLRDIRIMDIRYM